MPKKRLGEVLACCVARRRRVRNVHATPLGEYDATEGCDLAKAGEYVLPQQRRDKTVTTKTTDQVPSVPRITYLDRMRADVDDLAEYLERVAPMHSHEVGEVLAADAGSLREFLAGTYDRLISET
ncbi:MAG: hypothetical protein ACYCST_16965 [Acidimicrobiales bacterium]